MSNFFYNTNGIYSRMCNYFAFLYRYDWYIVPERYQEKGLKTDKIIEEFYRILNYFDKSNIKKLCGDVALEVIRNGAYYGYIVEDSEQLYL